MRNLIFLLVAMLVLGACDKGNDNPPEAILTVEPMTAIGFSAVATESFDIIVTTNQSLWDAVSSQSWCMVAKSNGKFTVTAAANASTSSPAPAVITITAGAAKPITINVTQAGASAELSVSHRTPVSFASTGGTSDVITITTNQSSWNAVSNQTWCTVSKDGNSFTIAASTSAEAESRNAVITVSAGTAANVTINVTQEGVGAQLAVSPDTPITFTSAGGSGETKTITVTTNQLSWNAVASQSWCTITKSGNQFTAIASSYTGTAPRKATITVSAGSAANITIDVTQTGAYTEDPNLEKAIYTLGYAANAADQFNNRGLKPSTITLPGTTNQVAISLFYLPNGALDYGTSYIPGGQGSVYGWIYYGTEMGRRPFIMTYISSTDKKEKSFEASSAIRSGNYDYSNDPTEVIAYFGDWMGSSVFTSLSNLKLITNNNAITEQIYNSISFSTNCYKMIVFGKNSSGNLIGKYVGYSTDGKIYIYWCIDPDSPSFGEKTSKNTPYS